MMSLAVSHFKFEYKLRSLVKYIWKIWAVYLVREMFVLVYLLSNVKQLRYQVRGMLDTWRDPIFQIFFSQVIAFK